MTRVWVLGGAVQQYWTVADTGDDRKVDSFVAQPFVNYNFAQGWALAFAPLLTADWDADAGHGKWTVPLGLGISRTTVFNRRPMTIGLHYYYNVVQPDGAPTQQLRFVVSLLYPR